MHLVLNILLLLISTFSASPVLAQSQQLKSDYDYNFSVYQQTHSQFQQSRQAYQKFFTLNTKETAIGHAKEAQLARLETIKTFLYLQKDRLSLHQDSSPTETQIIFQNMSQKIDALSQLATSTQKADNLEKINENNTSFNLLFKDISELIYQGQIRSESNRLLSTLKKTSRLLDSLDQGPILNPAKQSWINQTRQDLETANQQINSALQAPIVKNVNKDPYQKSFKKSLEYLNQSQETQEKILKNTLEIKNLL